MCLDIIKDPRKLINYIKLFTIDFFNRLIVSRKYFLLSPVSYVNPTLLRKLYLIRKYSITKDIDKCTAILTSIPQKSSIYPLFCFELGKAMLHVGDSRYCDYICKAVELENSPPRLKYYIGTVSATYKVSDLARVLDIFNAKKDKYHPYRIRWVNNYTGWVNLYRGLLEVPYKKENKHFSSNKKVMMILHNSLGVNSGGYATRAHGLLKSLKASGVDVMSYTRYAYPWDMLKGETLFNKGGVAEEEIVDGVLYKRIYGEGAMINSELSIDQYIRVSAMHYEIEAEKNEAGIIHAASNFYTGFPSLIAARNLGLPFIYEVRGLWEITRASRDPKWGASEMYRLYADMETTVAVKADHVITITSALKELLIKRGVPSDKITVAPNGVDLDKFAPVSRDEKETNMVPVIGYIGSFVDYEGLEYLLEASAKIKDRVKHELLLVGDGKVYDQLKAKAAKLGLNNVTFTGRISHDQIADMYDKIDIVVYPRKGYEVCEIVSPIKPFEAMAMQKAILVSDVAALAEFIIDGVTGIVFRKDDVSDLALKMETLISDRVLVEKLSSNSHEWVHKNRNWLDIADKVKSVYEDVLS